ncbi:cupin domain-containing protein [Rhodobacteraceae bacterium NNCM2]|nr:cupin domain-containing protein [Coraliihabitans acroporae]
MTTTGTMLSAAEISANAFAFRHPLDPAHGCAISPISKMLGLRKVAINLTRIAPGEQAFPLHRHHGEEEWVYIVDGTGDILMDDEVHAVGPGDFAAFHAAGAAHAVRNTGEGEMICLMGGDSPATDIVDFPNLGKRVVKTAAAYETAPDASFETIMRRDNAGEVER